jgi:UDP-glucose:(heptosyl)LPS alpha-1,3-glucosyltransferase
LRILLLVSEYHRRGGFPRHGADLAAAFAARGNDVTVLTRHVEAEARDDGITFIHYHAPRRPMLLGMALEPRALAKALRPIAHQFDAVLSVGIPVREPVVLIGPGTHRGYFLNALSSLPRTSLRRWVELVRPFHRIVMSWERAMLRGGHARLVVVGGDTYAREYIDMFDVPPERVAVVPHGIDLEEFRFDPEARRRIRAELGIDEDTKLMLNVAGRSRQKGLDVICSALDRLPLNADWKFAFAGDGSGSPALARRTRRLRKQGRVLLLGRVPSVRDLYSAADLLVFPSRYDPWGMAVTEALACGLPVVCSSHIGSASAVRPGENGLLLVDHQDPQQLAYAVESLLRVPIDREVVAASVQAFSWDAAAAMLELVLDERTRTTNTLEPKGVR